MERCRCNEDDGVGDKEEALPPSKDDDPEATIWGLMSFGGVGGKVGSLLTTLMTEDDADCCCCCCCCTAPGVVVVVVVQI